MRRFLTCTLFLLLIIIVANNVFAQKTYGHEWIKPGQSYFRIPVTENGFYKIEGRDFLQAKIPIDSIPHRSFQIFRRGRELACEVIAQNDDYLGSEGSIAFYAEKNDGVLDARLYVQPSSLPHPFYSLYSDTASFFLTWRIDGGQGARIGIAENPITENIGDYHYEEVQQLFTAFYAPGQFYPPGSNYDTGIALTTYDVGEGWTGPELKYGEWGSFDLQTSHAIPEHFDKAEVELVIVGRSAGKHRVELWTGGKGNPGRKLSEVNFAGYQATTIRASLERQYLSHDGKVNISISQADEHESISVSLIRWRYPQKIIHQHGISQKMISFDSSFSDKTILINDPWKKYYDLSDLYQIREIKTDHSQFGINHLSKIIAVDAFLRVPAILPVHFKTIDPKQIDYLMISHPVVRSTVNGMPDPVESYATYRASNEGGGYKPMILNSQEVYDQFGYGEPGPLGIRNIIRWLTDHGNLKFAFLIGQSVDPQRARKLPRPRDTDMVPNAGWPGSDLSLAVDVGLDPTTVTPRVPVGRINAISPVQVWTYLQKVMAMESEPASAPWRKKILHLSGGRSATELALFRSYVDLFTKTIENSFLAASVSTFSKKTIEPVEQFPLEKPLNNGIALMTLFGHSGVNVTDLDIGYASDPKREYANQPFFPAVIVNGCATGSIFYSPTTISNDWIFAPGSGAVLFLAHTFNGVSTALKNYTESFYKVLADSRFTSAPFGIIQKEAIRRNMVNKPTIADIITAHQMNLHGDPAIRIFPSDKPDYAFDTTLFRISVDENRIPYTGKDTLVVRLGIANYGRFVDGSVKLQFTRMMGDSVVKDQYTIPSFAITDTLFLKIPHENRYFGRERWNFTLDPDNEIPEENKYNNFLYRELILPQFNALALLPLHEFKTNDPEIELVARVPDHKLDSQVIFEWAFTEDFSEARRSTVYAQRSLARMTIKAPDFTNKTLYWRVYLAEHASQHTPSRSVHWSEEPKNPMLLPEVVVSILPNNFLLDEGESYNGTVFFQNARDIGFQDSISVQITQTVGELKLKKLIKIAPLDGNEIRDMELSFPTRGLRGENTVDIEFNSEMLSEEIFANNGASLSFVVLPDLMPPLLLVQVDGRKITDNEAVSVQPSIAIQVIDENAYMVRRDTAGIAVYLSRDCNNCDAQRIDLDQVNFSSTLPNIFTLEGKIPKAQSPGKYFLRVTATDVAGNDAIPYQISYRIQESPAITKAGISPNPANTWFRFFAEIEGITVPDLWIITVTNQTGQEIQRLTKKTHKGTNEIYWEPTGLPPGIFLYRMEFQGPNWPPSPAAKAGMDGKLIWMP
jgi:hypothetical protein